MSRTVYKNDWDNANALCKKWIEKEKTIFYQQKYLDLEKRVFLLVIMTPHVIKLAQEISMNSSSAIDSTFKTNSFRFPLYVAICLNRRILFSLWFAPWMKIVVKKK